jgi:hypothetical protein
MGFERSRGDSKLEFSGADKASSSEKMLLNGVRLNNTERRLQGERYETNACPWDLPEFDSKAGDVGAGKSTLLLNAGWSEHQAIISPSVRPSASRQPASPFSALKQRHVIRKGNIGLCFLVLASVSTRGMTMKLAGFVASCRGLAIREEKLRS